MQARAGEHEIDEWARRAQRGDELALGRLLHAVRPRVYRWALVHTGAADDAEDITQAVLLRAQRRIGDFNFAARFTTWLYSVTRSVAADWRRTNRRRSELLMHRTDETMPVPQREATPDEQRLVALIREHFAALPVRQREVFDLVDLQGQSPSEVAAMLALDPATVRVHLMRARRTIRARILERHAALVEDR